MIRDVGDMPIHGANEMNIPVMCFMHEPESPGGGLWVWTARNYMPRKECLGNHYRLEADTRDEILAALTRWVLPLYEVATANIRESGHNYYWERKTPAPSGAGIVRAVDAPSGLEYAQLPWSPVFQPADGSWNVATLVGECRYVFRVPAGQPGDPTGERTAQWLCQQHNAWLLDAGKPSEAPAGGG